MAELQDLTPVTSFLDAQAIHYRLFRHPGPIESLEQAARERGQQPDQVIRSILFRLAQGEYIMVLVAGARQVSWPKLRQFLGQSRLTMAKPEEVHAVTGYVIGAVSPFGLPKPLRILADASIFLPEEISIGSGERGLTVILKRDDLRRALGSIETGDFV